MTRHDQPASLALRTALWSGMRLALTIGYPDFGPWQRDRESRKRLLATPQRRLRRQRRASICASASLAQASRKLKSP